MANLEQDSGLLDDHSLSSDQTLGAHYPPYIRWMRFCTVVVGLYAVGGFLLFSFISSTVVTDWLWSWYNSLSDQLVSLLVVGSVPCCLFLILGCIKAWQYTRSLRSATFVNASLTKRWEYASPQAHRLWRMCAWATLTFVLSWGPFFAYEGYKEIKHVIRYRAYYDAMPPRPIEMEDAMDEEIELEPTEEEMPNEN